MARTVGPAPIFQFKITLKRSKPPIWRRVLMLSAGSLADLHQVVVPSRLAMRAIMAATTRIDRVKLHVALQDLDEDLIFGLLDQVLDLLPPAKVRALVAPYVDATLVRVARRVTIASKAGGAIARSVMVLASGGPNGATLRALGCGG